MLLKQIVVFRVQNRRFLSMQYVIVLKSIFFGKSEELSVVNLKLVKSSDERNSDKCVTQSIQIKIQWQY